MMIGALKRTMVVALVLAFALGLAGCASAEPERVDLREGLSGPALAVFDLAEAAESGNLTGVRTYMDSTAVGLTFAAETMRRLNGDDATSTPSPGINVHGSGFNASVMERTFAEQFTGALQKGVENGTVVADGTLLAVILEAGPGQVEQVNDSEALVAVLVPATEEVEAQDVRLRMARTGDRWMLVAVEGTTDLYGLFF